MKREPLTDSNDGGGSMSPIVAALLFLFWYVPRDELRLWRERRR